MGQLALLLRDAGHEVSGSDTSFDPPMGPALEDAGIRCLHGFDAEHIAPGLDRVVIGNAIRKENPEARRAEELGLARASMSGTLRELFLEGRRPLVVAGTHGKTTTASMCAWILHEAGLEPGFFIGGLPKNFPSGAAIGSTKRKLVTAATGTSAKAAPFVVEGDEYDAVYWNKRPKFFDYVGVGRDDVVMITSIEQDHIDIYPSAGIYDAQFEELAALVPGDGVLVCDARDARVRRIVGEHAEAKTVFYGLEGDDTGSITPTWQGAIAPPDPITGVQPFDLYAGGSFCGRFALDVPGAHNFRNAVGAIAACAEGFGVGVAAARTALASFKGVRRRQDLLGRPDGIAVYDDFAHHPTAVDETLRALRARHPGGRLWAVFEPRSATACRALHQQEYVQAFGVADRVFFSPLGRTNIPEGERLDLARLAGAIGADKATAAPSVDAILELIVKEAQPGDTVALLSNGAFGGIHAKLLTALGNRATARR
ncbi:UDP-N-acetylmuramate:L-alanyl-gamma-D-glutamyl-meso-diaminopimelate ligase [soil metagenome]